MALITRPRASRREAFEVRSILRQGDAVNIGTNGSGWADPGFICVLSVFHPWQKELGPEYFHFCAQFRPAPTIFWLGENGTVFRHQ